jgi:hypothetical protein
VRCNAWPICSTASPQAVLTWCRCTVVEFTTEQVAGWLEEANASRRARWVHWPDPGRLAADLSTIDFGVSNRCFAHHEIGRQVKQFTGMLRRLAALWDNPTPANELRRVLVSGIGPAFYTADVDRDAIAAANAKADAVDADADRAAAVDAALDASVAQWMADARALGRLWEDPDRFTRALHEAAELAEWQHAQGESLTYASFLRLIYTQAFRTLEGHTGSQVSTRSTGPDARFVRDVLEHAQVPWRPKTWRAAVQCPFSPSPQDRGGRSRARTVPFGRKKNLRKGECP